MTDPRHDVRRDLERLREMKRTAEDLLASSDPLLRGQYLHLAGRLDTLIDILSTTVGEPS